MTATTIVGDGYMPQPPLALAEYRERCGHELGRSSWITIDQPMIDAFAALTGDRQAIHLDPARAHAAGYPSTIAHGFLTLSLVGGLGPQLIPPVADATVALNYGLDRARLVTPVPSGSRVRAVFRLHDVHERTPGQVRLVIDTVIELE